MRLQTDHTGSAGPTCSDHTARTTLVEARPTILVAVASHAFADPRKARADAQWSDRESYTARRGCPSRASIDILDRIDNANATIH